MENMERDQQVWQRVRSCAQEVPESNLVALQREALELAAAYRSLTRRLSGSARELAAKLAKGEQANAAALAGIGHLSRQPGETVKLWQPRGEEPKKALQRCYHRTRRCMAEFTARSLDPEFGVVFEKLAKREGEHCALIAELLGRDM